MTNLSIEILFWTILLIYIGARVNQRKKGLRNDFKIYN